MKGWKEMKLWLWKLWPKCQSDLSWCLANSVHTKLREKKLMAAESNMWSTVILANSSHHISHQMDTLHQSWIRNGHDGWRQQITTSSNRTNEETKHSTGVWMGLKSLVVTETWDNFHVFQEMWNQRCPLGKWRRCTLLMQWNLDHEISNNKCESKNDTVLVFYSAWHVLFTLTVCFVSISGFVFWMAYAIKHFQKFSI
jgi:hypothetical protein